jgi:hypothetical protein
MISRTAALAVFSAIVASAPANATVTISTAATQNMTCSGGVCAPTATDATLNVTDLENLLASGNVVVTTTGSGVQADNVVVAKKLAWSTSNSLTLDAYDSVTIRQPVSILGGAGLAVRTNDGGSGGTLSFGRNGSVFFAKLSSALSINGTSYVLVNTIAGLARHVAQNPNGNYAFARNHDAGRDGTYQSAPVATLFTGRFEGLGNAISNLSISDTTPRDDVGLFASLGVGGSISDISLTNAAVQGVAGNVGVLAGINQGSVNQSYASGVIKSTGTAVVGGLVGLNEGSISYSRARVDASGHYRAVVGGLVGENSNGAAVSDSSAGGMVEGQIAGDLVGSNDSGASVTNSRATGTAMGYMSLHEGGGPSGGLVGSNSGTISGSSATGKVIGGNDGIAGGLVGSNGGTISTSYATGALDDTRDPEDMGGLVGSNAGSIDQSYATGNAKETQSAVADYLIGGLVGGNEGSITNSFATGNMTASGYGNYYIGGLAGLNYYGSISTCYAAGAVSGEYGGAHTGGLVGENYGTIASCNATGDVTGFADAGGLVDVNDGGISDCYALGNVTAQNAGGLAGYNLNYATIDSSFAMGAVSSTLSSPTLGGLVSQNQSTITNSYATGSVTGQSVSTVGGLVGAESGSISYAYSTGAVTGGTVGGSMGSVIKGAKNTDVYWDTTTSGTETGVGQGSSSGIAGLTTEQLQSGLPNGFSLSIWAENSGINNGLPYLIANPQPQ